MCAEKRKEEEQGFIFRPFAETRAKWKEEEAKEAIENLAKHRGVVLVNGKIPEGMTLQPQTPEESFLAHHALECVHQAQIARKEAEEWMASSSRKILVGAATVACSAMIVAATHGLATFVVPGLVSSVLGAVGVGETAAKVAGVAAGAALVMGESVKKAAEGDTAGAIGEGIVAGAVKGMFPH